MGKSSTCGRSVNSGILQFRIPDGILPDDVESVMLNLHYSKVQGGSVSLRLDGLGLHSGDQDSALMQIDAGRDFYTGFSPDSNVGVVEIDKYFYTGPKESLLENYLHQYSSPALTKYVQDQVRAGGAGKYLALRVSNRYWYGCLDNACYGCWLKRVVIAQSTEALVITAKFSSSAQARAAARSSTPFVDGVAVTELHAADLEALDDVEETDMEDHDTPWLGTAVGHAVAFGAVAALAVLAGAAIGVAIWSVRRYRPAYLRESIGHKSVPRTSYAEYSDPEGRSTGPSPPSNRKGNIPHKPFSVYASEI